MRQHPFIVTGEKALQVLPGWLGKRGCNSCSFSDQSKINIGIERGRKYTYVASVIIKDPELFERALLMVKDVLYGSVCSTGCGAK